MTTKRVLVLLTVMVFLFTLPAVAYAQESPPHIFIGSVLGVGGGSVAVGTVVTAYINGELKGSTTVKAGGKYQLEVKQGTGTGISFKIGNFDVAETATWAFGGAMVLTLTAVSTVVIQPTPVTSVQGPQGETGPQGSPGAPGAPGAQGAPGATGPQGETGATGAAGPTGSAGSAGAVGPAGEAGGSIFGIIALLLSAVAATLALVAFLGSRTSRN